MSSVSKLRKQIADCEKQIEAIQKSCTHPLEAQTRDPAPLPITVHYEDEIGGQSGTDFRTGYSCSCGLCEKE